MTELNRFRDGIRRFISNFEKPVLWVFRGAFSFWILHLIRTYFGYSAALEDTRLGIAIAMICAFVPWSFGALVLLIVLLLELYSLSPLVALIALAFVVLGYLLCAFYGSKHVHNIAYIPPCYPSQFSFAMPMISALFGSVSEITSVLCGGVFAFFLATIRKNSTMFIDSQAVSIPDLLMQTMLGNRLLYYYLAALSAMFLVTWVLRTRRIPHSWLIAILAGVASETAIMAVGYSATGNSGRISELLLINLLLIGIGIVINFFVRGLDYARIEDLQFEDDDYVYYVRAVPKMHFVEEEKRVKRITGEQDEDVIPEKKTPPTPVRRTPVKKTEERVRKQESGTAGRTAAASAGTAASSAFAASTGASASTGAPASAARPAAPSVPTPSSVSAASSPVHPAPPVLKTAPSPVNTAASETASRPAAAASAPETAARPAAAATAPETASRPAAVTAASETVSRPTAGTSASRAAAHPAAATADLSAAKTAARSTSARTGTAASGTGTPRRRSTAAPGTGAAKPSSVRRTTAKEGASSAAGTAPRAPRRTLTPEEREARREAQARRAAQKAAETAASRMRPLDDASADTSSKGE